MEMAVTGNMFSLSLLAAFFFVLSGVAPDQSKSNSIKIQEKLKMPTSYNICIFYVSFNDRYLPVTP